MRDGAKPSFSL